MLPVVQVGPLALQVPGLLLLAGLWLGLWLAERNANRSGIHSNDLYNLVFVALVSGVIGARLIYAIRYWSSFSASPTNLFSLNPRMLDPWGGLAVALIASLIYGQRKKMPLWPTLDALTPALAVLAVAQGLSHLASGAAFGAITNLAWGIETWGARRHPSQIYEIIATATILGLIWPVRGLIRPKQAGIYFLSFISLSAAARLFLEAFRGDSQILPGGFRSIQIIAWVVLFISLWGISRLNGLQASQSIQNPITIQTGDQ
jgi:phosphatidylglycerol:prolipoprotein diacylglycerol transferase